MLLSTGRVKSLIFIQFIYSAHIYYTHVRVAGFCSGIARMKAAEVAELCSLAYSLVLHS